MSATPTSTQVKIDAAMDAAASQPAAVSGEMGSATNRSVDDLIKLDRYNRGKLAAENRVTGLIMRRLRAGGAHS
jgi:hypothetical protein